MQPSTRATRAPQPRGLRTAGRTPTKAEAFEQGNARLGEAVDELGDALRRAMDDKRRPAYATVGRARWDRNEAIAILRSYLRTGLAPGRPGRAGRAQATAGHCCRDRAAADPAAAAEGV